MHYWRAVFVHTSFVLVQPTYLALQYLLDHECFSTRSYLNLIIHAGVWTYIITRISIPFFKSPLRRLPSPPNEHFPLCHLNFNGGRPGTTIFENMMDNTPNDGIIVVWGPFYLFTEIIITRPDTLMDMINTHNYDWQKPTVINKVISRILGEGLATVEGAKHKAMRRVVTPAFSGHLIRDLAPLFYTKGIALAEVMARQIRDNDGALEITALMSRVTLDIIGAAGVGKDFNTLDNEDSHLAKLYDSVANPAPYFLLIDMLLPRWITRNLWGTTFAATVRAQSQLHREIRALMQEKKVDMKQEESTQQKDIIASIMRSGDFSDEYLMSQMLTFLAAGHDTTSAALTWTLYLLSLNPKIQTNLRSELTTTRSTLPINASLFDQDQTPYLNAVCNETLRLYPPAPGTSRHSIRPTTINSIPIPKGTTATIPFWAINRSPLLWGEDAHIFNPDRWLPDSNGTESGGATTPHAFTTFLFGPRSCIGQTFARLEMKCVLAALVRRFRFEIADPEKKVEIGGFVTIKPLGGLRLKVFDLVEEKGE